MISRNQLTIKSISQILCGQIRMKNHCAIWPLKWQGSKLLFPSDNKAPHTCDFIQLDLENLLGDPSSFHIISHQRQNDAPRPGEVNLLPAWRHLRRTARREEGGPGCGHQHSAVMGDWYWHLRTSQQTHADQSHSQQLCWSAGSCQPAIAICYRLCFCFQFNNEKMIGHGWQF